MMLKAFFYEKTDELFISEPDHNTGHSGRYALPQLEIEKMIVVANKTSRPIEYVGCSGFTVGDPIQCR